MGYLTLGLMLLAVAADGSPDAKVYEVRYLAAPKIVVDGQASEAAWDKANLETGFTFPWKKEPAPSTQFRALCDDENLYFTFRVHDDDIVADENYAEEMDAAAEDRVEFYFAPDLKLDRYYCVEMDSRGRMLDYRAAFYRKCDFSWSFPGLRFKTSLVSNGYVVEGLVPLKTFQELGLPSLESGKLRVGIFRAEFSHGPSPEPVENWIAWVDPKTEKPDFHVRTSLGIFKKVK